MFCPWLNGKRPRSTKKENFQPRLCVSSKAVGGGRRLSLRRAFLLSRDASLRLAGCFRLDRKPRGGRVGSKRRLGGVGWSKRSSRGRSWRCRRSRGGRRCRRRRRRRRRWGYCDFCRCVRSESTRVDLLPPPAA